MSGSDSHRRTHLRWPLVGRLAPPFGDDFVAVEATGALVLVAAVVGALAWANIAPGSYESVWSHELTLGLGSVAMSHSLREWIGEGLMTVFFFVLGLELKRELVTGALRSARVAALPIGAAVGGAILPALIFTLIVRGGSGASGWAVPMATDAALALGLVTAFGRRAAPGTKTILLAIAIVDDLIAILVIALFFTGGLTASGLLATAGAFASVLGLRVAGVRHPLAYVPSGIALWLALGAAGIHPTVAGAALGLLTPARPPADAEILGRIERRVHPWAALVVVPVFALASVGVEISADTLRALGEPLALGVALGLVVGKAVGIAVTGALLVRAHVAALPAGAGTGELVSVAFLGGIGLSVALFITDLALDGELAEQATMGILVGSLISAGLGTIVVLATDRRRSRSRAGASGSMSATDREESV